VTYRTLAATVATGALASAAARVAYRVLVRRPPGGEQAWSRVNHRGEPVTLLEGPAAAAGALAAALLAAPAWPARDEAPRAPGAPSLAPAGLAPRLAVAAALAGGGAAAFGVLDDLKGSGKRRGLRGHLGALRHGEVTTGAVKLAGIGAAAALAALALPGRARLAAGDLVIDAGLIAGGANLLNLFDLRPGRAIKVAALSAGLIAAVSAGSGRGASGLAAVAAPAGAALAVLPEDLGERAMLGDGGANALGALLGLAAAAALPRAARAGLLAVIVGLTAASEKVSFTTVIARVPALNWLDMLGRRPPATPAK
jgi:UDP-N-acetylmuramyl pentapeptide phosphotransferase/UDP-N-acetylglucosamine-1-phosphate transferase